MSKRRVDPYEHLQAMDPTAAVPLGTQKWFGDEVNWRNLQPMEVAASSLEKVHLVGDGGLLAARPHRALEWESSTAWYRLEAFGPDLTGYPSVKNGELQPDHPYLLVDNIGLAIERRGKDEKKYEPVDEGWLVYDSFRRGKRLRRVGRVVHGGFGFMPGGGRVINLQIVAPPKPSRLR